jgi:hypothetical protein
MPSSADLPVHRQHTLGLANSLPLKLANETTEPALPSNEKTTASEAMYSQSECFLFRLPPELRLTIYAFAMTPNIEQTASDQAEDLTSTVDLTRVATSAPSKTLLLTCRRIHREAKESFSDAQRTFWSNNTFSIELRYKWTKIGSSLNSIYLPWLRTEALDLIPRLILSVDSKYANFRVQYTDEGNLSRGARYWTASTTDEAHRYFRYLDKTRGLDPEIAKEQQLREIMRGGCACFHVGSRPRQRRGGSCGTYQGG